MKIFSAQLKGTTTVATGSNVSLTGSFSGSIAGIDINSTNTFTASTTSRLSSIETISASNISRINSLETKSASVDITNTIQNSRLSALETTSASVDSLNTTQNTRLTNLENKTGSLATTGSNTFVGTQIITGSLYVTTDLIVQGSSSIQNITGSSVNIGTNKIILNTANPAVRYAGISVIDSGSTGLTGSILWDSTNNNWVYQNPSGSSYTSAKFISGPQSSTLGSEPGLNSGYISKAVGDDHIGDSIMFESGSRIGIGITNPSAKLSVSGSIESLIDDLGERGGQLILRGQTYRWNIDNWNDNLRFFREDDATIANGTVKMFISSSGYVGIGTTTPKTSIHTYASNDRAAIRLQNTAASKVWELLPALNNVSNSGLSLYNVTDGATPFYITDGGDVLFQFASNRRFGIDYQFAGDYFYGIATDSVARATRIVCAAADTNAGIQFQTGASFSTATTKMIMTSGGDVGIGTTGPEQKLHIDGNTLIGAGTSNDFGQRYLQIRGSRGTQGASSATIYLSQIWNGVSYPIILEAQQGKVYGNAAADFVLKTSYYSGGVNTIERMRITDAGNVGIGTSAPNYLLHIHAAGSTASHIQLSNSTTGAGISNGARFFISGVNATINNREAGFLSFETTDTERMRITAGGNSIFKAGTGTNYATLTKVIGVGGSSSANISFDINAELGVPSAGYVMVEISAIGYAGQGSGGANYKAIVGGYSGHTVNSSYHKATEYVNNTYNNSISLYNPNNYTYGVSVTNSSGQGLNILLKLNVTWS